MVFYDGGNEMTHKDIFKDAFPDALSTLDFDVTTRDYNFFTASVTFKYTIFNITDPNGVRLDNNPQK